MTRILSRPIFALALAAILSACSERPAPAPIGAGADWAHYLGHPGSNQYSLLDQINTENVRQLEIAWTYDTGDTEEYQANNLVIGGVLYTATPTRKVTALDAATGEHMWTFDPDETNPFDGDKHRGGGRQRGVMYWEDGDDRRIFTTKGPWMYALDAATGEPIPSFGEGGWLHVGDRIDWEGRPNAGMNTPGYVYDDMMIFGVRVAENVPGAVIALDPRTGERIWIFHTLPRPGEFGSDTWPEGYLEHTGGASDWSGIALDTERGIVYSSTETAGPDFYGGDRYGENLFANSIIALDARTGERLWHFQFVHHDLWDMDNPTPPTLLTVRHEEEWMDIVAQGTKMGLLYVFDRVTGEPLWPIEERPAPLSELPDMQTWPTQPVPTRPAPLIRQEYTLDDVSNITPEARQLTTDLITQSGTHGSFPPPSLEQKIKFPGYDGGMEWGGSAADPDGIFYVNVNEIPWFYQLIPTRREDGSPLPQGERYYRALCASCHGLDGSGYPAGGFPALTDLAERYSREQAMTLLVQGGARMPPFDQMPEESLHAILDHLFGVDPAAEPADAVDASTPPYAFRGFQRWLDSEGYPAIKPPWGTLNAVDLNTGDVKWTVPLGEYEELTARGVPQTGTENYGGPIVTAGGVLFIGATADEKFRAFDKETGETLWEADLPFGGNATPSTYMANGKQYVTISAGGGKTNRPVGGMLVAFALPEDAVEDVAEDVAEDVVEDVAGE